MAKMRPGTGGTGLIAQLRDAIRGSGRTLQELARECGVGADRLSRFVRGERGLGLDAADKLFQALRLRVIRDQGEGPPPATPPG